MGRKVDLGGKKNNFFKIALKRVLILPKSKISKNAATPSKKSGFTKQKHIRGDKTLKIYTFGPNVNINV